jgi:glutamate 5-kinase
MTRAAIAAASRVVVKVGSSSLTAQGRIDPARLDALVDALAGRRRTGRQVVLVSSGAIAAGVAPLQLRARPRDLATQQAAASVGQLLLAERYAASFSRHGLTVGQVLLTADDLHRRGHYRNASRTLERLLTLGVIPIVNENDTVATHEIRFGDNDRLAALVAHLVHADALVLLSDVDGLYTADPRRDPAAEHIARVPRLTPEIEAMAGGANAGAGVGTGGMATKLAAARIASAAGCATVITLGHRPSPIAALEAGERATVIEPSTTPAAAYKAWIAGSLAPAGSLVVDEGAAAAVRRGKSLLAAGVRRVEGRFDKGDAVVITDETGREIARGLARYDAPDAARICGLKSEAIEPALGYTSGPLVHADDLAVAEVQAPR